MRDGVVQQLGPFPVADEIPNVAQDAWTTHALTEMLWKENVPEFSVLWTSEPDRSQYATSPGTAASLAAIKSADANLGVLLDALTAKGARDETDVLLASDHGFSTIERAVDVIGLLLREGFDLADETVMELPHGHVRVAGNGGTNLFYVGGHDLAVVERLVRVCRRPISPARSFRDRRSKALFRWRSRISSYRRVLMS